MAFCKFSSESVISSSTAVDNIFINNYLPDASGNQIKVYLYGLYKCANPNNFNNTLEQFASEIKLEEEEVKDAFLYWQEQGLVNVILGASFQVRFVPLKNILTNTKKFKKEKYAEFNKIVQDIFENRMISSNEYAEYYTIMEVYKLEPMALVMIIQYCVDLKGKNVGYAYVLTVARNWASENITTCESVEEKIKELNNNNSQLGKLLKICGIRRLPTVEEHEMFAKWTNVFGFKLDAITYVANFLNNKFGKVHLTLLDSYLTKYSNAEKYSIKEIAEYEENKTKLLVFAKNVCKTIGVFYENLENVIDTYITKWFDLGHNEDSVLMLAQYCFKTNKKTLALLDETILQLYQKGVVSAEAILEHINDIAKQNAEVKLILNKLGIVRNITAKDIEFVNIWKYTWCTSDDVIDFAIEKAEGKTSPMNYINKLLSTWHRENIKTIEQAKKFAFENFEKPTNTHSKLEPKNDIGRNYSKEQLDEIFKNLQEIEID